MLPVCHICLRSDRKLCSVHEDLENFFDAVCDYNNLTESQLCSECSSKLKKFHEFKTVCHLATKTLREWKAQKSKLKKSIHLLYQDIPQSQLSLSQKNNFKVYFYQTPDVNSTGPIEISNCKYPHIVTINIPREVTDNANLTEHKQDDKDVPEDLMNETRKIRENIKAEDIKEEAVEFVALDDCTDIDRHTITEDTIKIELNDEELNSNDDDKESDESIEEDSDASINELISILAKKRKLTEKIKIGISSNGDDKILKVTTDDGPKKKKRRLKIIDTEKLKEYLKEKFEISGVVKDEKGTVIDLDVVLNNIEKVSLRCLDLLNKACKVPGPLTALAISKLSEVYNRFTGYESLYDITHLSDEAQMRAEFDKRREYPEYLNSELRCEKCFKYYKLQHKLVFHNKTFHDESLPFECSLCRMRFKTEKLKNKHVSLSHTKVYKCKECEFITSDRRSMRIHFTEHKGVKRTCKYCGKQYKAFQSFYAHQKTHDPRNFCELCACAFMNESGLIRHKHLKHKGEEFIQSELNKKCDECDVTFINDDAYRKHLSVTHKIGLQRGRKVGFKVNGVTCDLCEWTGNLNTRRKHYETVHPVEYDERFHRKKTILCHDCGERFYTKAAYEMHMNRHNGVLPYACTKCPKKFVKKSYLKTHMQWHSPATKECNYCGKKFKTHTNLANHIKTHIGDRRYKCDICGKGFVFSVNLRSHIKGVHHNIKRVRKRPENK